MSETNLILIWVVIVTGSAVSVASVECNWSRLVDFDWELDGVVVVVAVVVVGVVFKLVVDGSVVVVDWSVNKFFGDWLLLGVVEVGRKGRNETSLALVFSNSGLRWTAFGELGGLVSGLTEELVDPANVFGDREDKVGESEGLVEELVDASTFLGEGGIGVVTFDAGMKGRKETSLALVFSRSGFRWMAFGELGG